MTPETAWKATLGELELQMTRATYNTWLKDAKLLSAESNTFTIGVRNDYARDWLENRLKSTILRTLSAVAGYKPQVQFVVRNAEPAMTAVATPAHNAPLPEATVDVAPPPPPVHERKRRYGTSNTLNARYVFDTFIVGNNNRLAHAASLSVAEQPGQAYNPLFIYGGVGLGKTHLLHAVGNHCANQGMDVLYVSSETFTNDLIQSIRSQRTAEFRDKYRTPDVLLIDDIQFIAGKESTQEELFHTFNALHSSGRQVVISSDRPPKAMVLLEERLQSRFEWGLMADIQLPDQEMRLAILQSKAEEAGIDVPPSVLEFISHRVRNNIRELEGALNKVIAYANLTGEPVTQKIVQSALADLIRTAEKVNVEQVIRCVCKHYGVTDEALRGSGRKRAISLPRQVAMYLARTETDASFPQIGQHLGKRDHTTILHGYERIDTEVESNANLRRDVMTIKAALYEQPTN